MWLDTSGIIRGTKPDRHEDDLRLIQCIHPWGCVLCCIPKQSDHGDVISLFDQLETLAKQTALSFTGRIHDDAVAFTQTVS